MLDLSKVVHVGFTGTREGMTQAQSEKVQYWLREFVLRSSSVVYFHHGVCRGADSEAHDIATLMGYQIVLHPSTDETYTNHNLNMESVVRVMPKFSYSGRNQRIALASDVVIGTPKRPIGQGGTWNCLKHAMNAKKPRIIVSLTGDIVFDGIN